MYAHYERHRSDHITDPDIRQQRPVSTITGQRESAALASKVASDPDIGSPAPIVELPDDDAGPIDRVTVDEEKLSNRDSSEQVPCSEPVEEEEDALVESAERQKEIVQITQAEVTEGSEIKSSPEPDPIEEEVGERSFESHQELEERVDPVESITPEENGIVAKVTPPSVNGGSPIKSLKDDGTDDEGKEIDLTSEKEVLDPKADETSASEVDDKDEVDKPETEELVEQKPLQTVSGALDLQLEEEEEIKSAASSIEIQDQPAASSAQEEPVAPPKDEQTIENLQTLENKETQVSSPEKSREPSPKKPSKKGI